MTKRKIGGRKKRKRTNEGLPMNRKLWTKIKRKQRHWDRSKEVRENNMAPIVKKKAEEEYRIIKKTSKKTNQECSKGQRERNSTARGGKTQDLE